MFFFWPGRGGGGGWVVGEEVRFSTDSYQKFGPQSFIGLYTCSTYSIRIFGWFEKCLILYLLVLYHKFHEELFVKCDLRFKLTVFMYMYISRWKLLLALLLKKC